MVMRANNPVSKYDIISFCREHIDIIKPIHDEVYKINNEEFIDKMNNDDFMVYYKDHKRRIRDLSKPLHKLLSDKFGYSETGQAINRVIRVYEENKDEINGIRKNGFYWVKYMGDWIVLRYLFGSWRQNVTYEGAIIRPLDDNDFEEIDNRALKR